MEIPGFQFQIRSMLAVTAMYALGLAIGVNATASARAAFLITLTLFLVGVGLSAYVADARHNRVASLLMTLFAQTLVLGSGCLLAVSLGVLIRSLIEPWVLAT